MKRRSLASCLVLLSGLISPASFAQSSETAPRSTQKTTDDAKALRQIRKEADALRRQEASATSEVERQRVTERRRQLWKRLDDISSRVAPRSRYAVLGQTDAATEEYGKAVATKIEEYGTTNFPSKEGKAIYGRAVLNVTIAASGTVEQVEIARSSGSKQLDRHAVEVVHRVAPFAPFSEPLKREIDRIVFTLPFNYRRESESRSDSTRPETPNPSINRTSNSWLRHLLAAGYVKR